jgi:hypothetical protein
METPTIIYNHVGFEVLTAAVMKFTIFWDIAQCIPFSIHISEEHITSIFKVGNQPRKRPVCY